MSTPPNANPCVGRCGTVGANGCECPPGWRCTKRQLAPPVWNVTAAPGPRSHRRVTVRSVPSKRRHRTVVRGRSDPAPPKILDARGCTTSAPCSSATRSSPPTSPAPAHAKPVWATLASIDPAPKASCQLAPTPCTHHGARQRPLKRFFVNSEVLSAVGAAGEGCRRAEHGRCHGVGPRQGRPGP